MAHTDTDDDGRDATELKEAARLLNVYAADTDDMRAHDLAERVERLMADEDPLPDADEDGKWLRGLQEDTHEWRVETIGDDITPLSQAAHTAVEASELLNLLVKEETYASGEWAGDELEAKREAGDIVVAGLGVMSLLGLDAVECVDAALEKNGARDWADHKREGGRSVAGEITRTGRNVSREAAEAVASDLEVTNGDD